MSGAAAQLLPLLRSHARLYVRGAAWLAATNACAAAVPWVVKLAVEDLEQGRGAGRLPSLVGALVVLALGQAAFRVASRADVFGAAREIELDLRAGLTRRWLELTPGSVRAYSTGDLLSRAVADVGHVRMLLGPGLLNVVNVACALPFALLPMLWISPGLTALTLAPVPVFAVTARVFVARLHRRARELQERLAELSHVVEESVAGHAVVRAFAAEEHEGRVFEDAADRHLAAALAHLRAQGLLAPVMGALAGAGSLLVLWGGGTRVVEGRMTLGALIAFWGYLGGLVWPLLSLAWVLGMAERARAALGRITEASALRPEVEAPAAGLVPERSRDAAPALRVRGLVYAYPGARSAVLGPVDLDVAPGERLALVGPVGGGKSTLLAALARLVEVPPGTVWIDGTDVRRLALPELRARIGYAPQEAFLFSDTIAANVVLARPHAIPARVAADAAGLTRDVAGFPEGLETRVGPRGVRLSAGQRSRVALARTLAGEPPLLLLDDPFAAVDAETETLIVRSLTDGRRSRTIVLATHRLEALAAFDRVVVLDRGEVVEQGAPHELERAGGLYAELVRLGRARRSAAEVS